METLKLNNELELENFIESFLIDMTTKDGYDLDEYSINENLDIKMIFSYIENYNDDVLKYIFKLTKKDNNIKLYSELYSAYYDFIGDCVTKKTTNDISKDLQNMISNEMPKHQEDLEELYDTESRRIENENEYEKSSLNHWYVTNC